MFSFQNPVSRHRCESVEKNLWCAAVPKILCIQLESVGFPEGYMESAASGFADFVWKSVDQKGVIFSKS